MVQSMYSSGANYGFLIRDAAEDDNGNGVQQQFYSKESSNNKPQLLITYTQGP
jgi:hypothetical protein